MTVRTPIGRSWRAVFRSMLFAHVVAVRSSALLREDGEEKAESGRYLEQWAVFVFSPGTPRGVFSTPDFRSC